MSASSDIGWTDATWPLVAGCDYVSPGCSNCWAVRDSWRLAHNPHKRVQDAYFGTVDKRADGKLVWSGIVRELWDRLEWPLKWRGSKRIFVCSQADLFHRKVTFEFIAALFGVAAMCPEHTFQVLTKHPKRALEFFVWLAAERGTPLETCLWNARRAVGHKYDNRVPFADNPPAWPLANVWFGVTVEDQKRADERIPHLLCIPATKRWLSVEPMLEAVAISTVAMPAVDVLANTGGLQHIEGAREIAGQGFDVCLYDLGGIDWVVCGGESAQTRANTRPFDLEWARQLKEECALGGIAFFMKQLGTKPLNAGEQFVVWPKGKTRRYKWHEPQHWPVDLQVQQFPPQ